MVDTGEDKGLNFAERHWLLLCIIVAILSPLIVHWVQGAAHRESYRESLEQPVVKGGVGATSPSGGAVAPGDTSRPGSVNPMTPSVHNSTPDTTIKK